MMQVLAATVLASGLVGVALGSSVAGEHGDPNAPIAGKVLGTVIHTDDPEELRFPCGLRIARHFQGFRALENGASRDSRVLGRELIERQDGVLSASPWDARRVSSMKPVPVATAVGTPTWREV